MRTILTLGIFFCAVSPGAAQDKNTADAVKKSDLVATTIIKVESIQCGSCVRTVEKALKGVPGVETAIVNLKKKTAAVTYVPSTASLAQLEDAISKSGYNANDKKADPAAYEKLDDCCKIAEE